ncbi:helix-turn-helix transcriptional regulator [Microbacterium sp. NPDC089987]|uniref:helix-turn-helix transcriptional regulator n=1 Tax=Microbacterium sp. NPDC089987 TaxID=3364202 RepID=UPI0038092999
MPDFAPADDPDFDALRRHLRRLRENRGWTYDELAAHSGVGRATLVSLELGKPRTRGDREQAATTGTLATWWRIASALQIDLGDLLRPLYGTEDQH